MSTLPDPVARRPVHSRNIRFDGFLRDDGLWDIDFNAATAAFQMIPYYRATQGGRRDEMPATGKPPFYMGQCMTWAFDGPVVQRVAPQFYRRAEKKAG